MLIVWPKIPPNASTNFRPKCLPKAKSLGFKKKLSLGVCSPCSVRCEKTQMQRLKTKNYKTTLDCAKKIMVKEFNKGTIPRLVRSELNVGINFMVYGSIMDYTPLSRLFTR